jgi:predicted ester cyclase
MQHTVVEGDKVADHLTSTGTHLGEFMGIPPTGRTVDFGEMAICRLAGGQIVSTWFQSDMLALMSQLGVGGEQPVPA